MQPISTNVLPGATCELTQNQKDIEYLSNSWRYVPIKNFTQINCGFM